jgi:hypothetical protein
MVLNSVKGFSAAKLNENEQENKIHNLQRCILQKQN